MAALLDGPEGPILGVLVGGARAELWRYGPDGARRSVTPLPGLRAISSLTRGPGGDVLVVGSFSDEGYRPWLGRFAGG